MTYDDWDCEDGHTPEPVAGSHLYECARCGVLLAPGEEATEDFDLDAWVAS